SDWIEQSKHAVLDDTVYVLTPQGRVVDLPRGATPVDFAYALHTDIGHRCRGAKVNGAIVPLDYRLKNAESVEIITAKTGGPSRDWLNPALGYIKSSRARHKVRQWFNRRGPAGVPAAGRAAGSSSSEWSACSRSSRAAASRRRRTGSRASSPRGAGSLCTGATARASRASSSVFRNAQSAPSGAAARARSIRWTSSCAET